jgi:ectoine hydroxylase-related dioxygenase (phytanoyl-CoA dioxygenase family)
VPGAVTPPRRDSRRELRRRHEEYERDGFLVAEEFVDPLLCDGVIAEAEDFYARQAADLDRVDRTMNFHRESPAARRILGDRRLRRLVTALLGARAVLFQSIYFTHGSEQHPHSDYMFMTTDPHFQLCGIWIACEDVSEEAGPLLYYPGSHRIPNEGIPGRYAEEEAPIRAEIEADDGTLRERYAMQMAGANQSLATCMFYDRWTKDLDRALDVGGYEPRTFLPRKGDLIVWHANLVHGGTPIASPDRTRRSLVAHYVTRAMRRLFVMNYPDIGGHMTLRHVRGDKRPAELYLRR